MTTDQHDPAGQVDGIEDRSAVATEAPPPAVDPVLVDVALASSLGEYVRAWGKRVRGGDTGNLPVLAGLVLIAVIFQVQNAHFLTAANFANLLEQTSYLVLFGMAEVFVLLLGEIDLAVGYNAACGAAVTLILAGQLHNFPWWLAALCGLGFTTLAGVLQGLLITRLRIPSFVVTLGGLLFFEGALLYILTHYAGAQTGGTVGITNSILLDIDNGILTPLAGWVLTIVLIVAYAAYVLVRDRRRRSTGLVAPPRSLELVKVVVVAVVGIAVVLVCNLNRGTVTPIRG